MRVLYDYQGFMQPHGGVSRYFAEIIRAMSRLEGFQALLPTYYTDNQYVEKRRIFITRRTFKGKVRVMAALNRRIAIRSLRSDYDLFHPTYFHPYFLGRARAPFILTVHDLAHHVFTGKHLRDDGTRSNMELLCRRAVAIVAVSYATKHDLCSLIGVPEEKVTVVHHATDLCYDGAVRMHPRRYILYVGERGGYKNFLFFLESVAGLLKGLHLDLLCAGSRPFSGEEDAAANRGSVRSLVRTVHVTTASELASLYHYADAFCYPSLHEGFGIPLLEAFSCRCPVVASSIPPFREVAGDAAEYFDPRNAASITSALENVLKSPRRASELARAGQERLSLFSWDAAARKTLAVYQAAL